MAIECNIINRIARRLELVEVVRVSLEEEVISGLERGDISV